MGYGFSHQDVAGVTGALGDLSQTLLRKRMMEQQGAQQEQQNELSRQRIGIERDQLTAQTKRDATRETSLDDYRKQVLASKQFNDGVKALNGQVENLQAQVDGGSMTEEEASAALKQMHERIDAAHQMIKDNSLLSNYAANGFKVRKGEGKKFADHTTATSIDLEKAQALEDEADELEADGDTDGAAKKRSDASILREAHKKVQRPGPQDRTEETVKPGEFGGEPQKTVKRVTYSPPGGQRSEGGGQKSDGGERIAVISPDGKTRGTIPASQWEAAKAKGYKKQNQ